MGVTDPEVYRRRLEGRAEVLETARLRYRELLRVLQGAWWRPWQKQLRPQLRSLQANLAQLREEPAVEEVLAAALHRVASERWPSGVPIVRCMHEVRALQGMLAQLLMRRLNHEEASLTTLLSVLEERLSLAPRAVSSVLHVSMAEVLPDTLPEVREVGEFGQLLASLFSGPHEPGVEPQPPGAKQLRELGARWPRGEAALAALWMRLEAVERTGELVTELRRRAGQAPVTPHSGLERLLYAEFWRSQARPRLEAWGRSRLIWRAPAEAELLAVGLWRCACENEREANQPPALRSRTTRSEHREILDRASIFLDSVPELREASDFGQFLASLFSRQHGPGEGLRPLGNKPVRELLRRWPRGEAVLAAVWARLENMAGAEVVVANLRRRAGQAPVTPQSGLERLMHAERWRGEARARLGAWGLSLLSFVEPSDAEGLAVVLRLCEDGDDWDVRLP